MNRLIDGSALPNPGNRLEEPQIEKLNELAMAGILPMFNRKEQLFCHRLRQSESGLVQEGVSHRYTMMTLLGLQKSAENGMQSPVNIGRVLECLLVNTDWIDNIGDLGLLLWTCASVCPDRLKDVSSYMDIEGALGRFRGVSEGRTMELAWFLSGLTHARLARPEFTDRFKGSAMKAYQLLRNNQGDRGLFGHLARKNSVSGLVRGHIGSFADQAYPIYALAKFGAAYDVSPATAASAACAETICHVQGELGQWWWHYDARNGTVLENYPVYSVHQHGMGPLALFAAAEAGGGDFTQWIYKGLRWVTGNNELGRDLRERPGNLIWRSVECGSRQRRYVGLARSVLGIEEKRESVSDWNVTRECRPYELGWLLFAFAGRAGSTSS